MDFAFKAPLMGYLKLENLAIDDLHTLDLGAASRLGGHVAAEALKCQVLLGNDNSEAGLKQGCRILSRRLNAWRRRRQAGKPKGRKTKTVSKLTLSMLGVTNAESKGHLHCKGAEARNFLPFALHLAKQLSPHLGDKGPHLVRAVASLQSVYELMVQDDPTFDFIRLGVLLEQCLASSKLAGVKLIHKFHLMRHFRSVSMRADNPARYSAYADETKNNETITIALKASTPDFARRILVRDYLQFHWREDVIC